MLRLAGQARFLSSEYFREARPDLRYLSIKVPA